MIKKSGVSPKRKYCMKEIIQTTTPGKQVKKSEQDPNFVKARFSSLVSIMSLYLEVPNIFQMTAFRWFCHWFHFFCAWKSLSKDFKLQRTPQILRRTGALRSAAADDCRRCLINVLELLGRTMRENRGGKNRSTSPIKTHRRRAMLKFFLTVSKLKWNLERNKLMGQMHNCILTFMVTD